MSTKYVILERRWIPAETEAADPTEAWVAIRDGDGLRVIEATGQDGALNRHEETLGPEATGTWKAVPLRSWKGGRSVEPVTRRARLPFED